MRLFLGILLRRIGRSSKPRTARDWLVALALMLGVAVLSFVRLRAAYAGVEVNNCILGADVVTYFNALAEGNYLALRVHKHAAAVVVIALLAKPLAALGVEPLLAGLLALAAIQGLAAAMIFALMRRHFRDPLGAAVLTLFVVASFGTITLFGIAETYGVTLASIAAACLLFGEIAPLARRWPRYAAIAAGLAAAMPALANAPALAFVPVYAAFALPHLRGRPLSHKLTQLLVPAVLAVAISMLPSLVAEGAQGASWQADYLDRYASWANFTDPRILADYAVSVVAFSWVAPLEWLQCRYALSDLARLAAQPLRLAALAATLGVLTAGLVRALRGPMRLVSLAKLAAALMLAAFYLYFNPDEALLYSPQWILALVLAAAPGIAGSRLFVGIAAVATGLMLAVNYGPLLHPRSHDPAVCCPAPPSTMHGDEMPRDLVRQGKVIGR
jgi:hypothetical protein